VPHKYVDAGELFISDKYLPRPTRTKMMTQCALSSEGHRNPRF